MKIRRSTEHGFTRGDFLKMSGAGLAGATLLGGAVSGGGIRGLMTEAAAAEEPGTAHCAADGTWINYPLTQDINPYRICTPLSLADVVATVREAEAARRHVHAFGSRWSFSDCAMTGDYLIDTTHLNRELQTVQHALRLGQSSSQLYHVEAGIRIRDLYENLNKLGLALETMGGASGQTLVGAISTGTHGGDKDMPPLADSVLAIHLVGAGGTQYWIEPSNSITNRMRLKERVVPGVEMQNIIYNDATFNACLVSLGCMGVIYAVVLRVREAYDLVETTVETTWGAFKGNASTYLKDLDNRFLQVILNPYTNSNNENLCLLTTRHEAPFTGTVEDLSPVVRPTGDVEAAVKNMLDFMQFLDITFYPTLLLHGVLDFTGLSEEQKLAKLVDGILTYKPGQRPVMVEHYGNILRAQWPTETFQGPSYSVMDLGYGEDIPSSQPGHSIELHFQSIDVNGRLGCADFIDALIDVVNASTQTFFTGYVSMRFTGATRASLGMQQWNQTCTVEISIVQGVQGLRQLLNELFRMGFTRGGLPHWGQELDLGVQGHGSLYRQYAAWRRIYAKMSKNFTARTFENELSSLWNLTTPDTGGALETLVVDKTVTVNESDFDVDTGVDMRTGDRLVVHAFGLIWAGVALTGNNGPQGWNNEDCDPKFPLPCSHPYSLLGKLNGSYFYIGSEINRVHTGGDSRLFLRINDDTPANGNGSFTAHIQVFRR
jgi:FAD binding domain